MNLMIELDENVIKRAVELAWSKLLTQPRYGEDTESLIMIREQVNRYLESVDISGYIKECHDKMLPKIIEDEVSTAIRAAVKREIAAAKKRGELA